MSARKLDQFYTKSSIAIKCYNLIKQTVDIDKYLLIEPSAGLGAFSNQFHSNSYALDLEPKHKNIIKQDFFDFDLNNPKNDKIITIGNPPFGKNSSLAIKFFNKSAEYSDYICMIFPITFKKDSVINKLNKSFKLIDEVVLEKNSFIFDDTDYDVKCVFQIWKKSTTERGLIPQKKETKYFCFVKKNTTPDFAIRRVGGLAGKVIEEYSKYKEPSHYFININTEYIKNKDLIIDVLKKSYKLFNHQAQYSVGNPSLSKHELITILEKELKKVLK